jgi:hypothetical protein
MVDGQDVDTPAWLVDAVHDPVVPSMGAVPTFELEPERPPDPVGLSARAPEMNSTAAVATFSGRRRTARLAGLATVLNRTTRCAGGPL